MTDVLSRYGEVHDVRFHHWLHMSEVADAVRVVSMVRDLVIKGYHCKVSYYGQAKESSISEKTAVRPVTFTVIVAMNLLLLPLDHLNCQFIRKQERLYSPIP